MPGNDQAEKLRRLVHTTRQRRTIAVTSGKGGVGKSNIALNLSILLSASGHRVALVDADLGLANLDVLVSAEVRADLSHVIAGTRRLEDIIVDLPSGVQLVPGASGLAKLADLSGFQRAQLLQELTALETDNDVVVVDCGAGIGPGVVQFAGAADSVLVVTAPEPTAITDSYAVIKVLKMHGYAGHIGLVVNLVADRQQARATQQRIAGVARRFLEVKVSDAGYVLTDAKVRQAVCMREPFVLAFPKCPASRSLAAVAGRLYSGGSFVAGEEGFFKRVANWFA